MTVYLAQDVMHFWERNGGAHANVVNAVAVSEAESNWNSSAISPSSDYGLWQINSIHFGNGIIDHTNWWDPNVNARAAIAISGNGTNWAAWCTAWQYPDGNCGHGYLPNPEPLSPAGRNVHGVAIILDIVTNAGTIIQDRKGQQQVQTAWKDTQNFTGSSARIRYGKIVAARNAMRGLPR